MGEQIRELSKTETLELYRRVCPLYFPPDELKPVQAVEALWDKGLYCAYGLFRTEEGHAASDEGTLLGFALLVKVPGERTALLDYFATLEQYRNEGLGGKCLALMAEETERFDGLLLECESPDTARTEDERSLRLRRIAFYERNGARPANFSTLVFGVRYTILFLPFAPASELSGRPEETCRPVLENIYRSMFSPGIYEKNVRFL